MDLITLENSPGYYAAVFEAQEKKAFHYIQTVENQIHERNIKVKYIMLLKKKIRLLNLHIIPDLNI